MTGALVAGLLAGYGIAMPVGAVGAYLVALTARTSLRTGACAALGVATADGVYALIAVVGGSALARVLEPVMVPLRWVSALVLIALAVRGGVAAIGEYREGRRAVRGDEAPVGPARAYVSLLGITLLNPMTVIYFTALVLGGGAMDAPGTLAQAVFVVAAFVASASWQLLLAGGGALLGKALTGSRGRLVTAMVSSALISALAVHLMVTARW
ncbi:LysE family transporter [Streptomyces ficellus]|uniref:LysE family transporter n=1 Tax=Streptomyces ficellus TaxID=1977088 RepID=A0ABT7ZBN3_9ACTN|nr:LysE family transporter [Streptomyces ficellus]MDN3296858.1 LysE family transporter [Streptomyces ficellus]